MLTKLTATLFAISATFGATQANSAEESADAPATIVVYRATESVKTKRINIGITGDSGTLGRLSANNVVVAERPAGEYTVDSRVRGTEPLTLDLKPGATYYIHADVAMRGSRPSVELQEVPEQVAKIQQPVVESTI